MPSRRHERIGSTDLVHALRSEMAGIAASAGSVERRAEHLLQSLAEAVPFAAAAMVTSDPDGRTHRPVGLVGSTGPLVRYLEHPGSGAEIDSLGLNRVGPPIHASTLPMPREQTLAWSEYLLPAGFVDGFTVSLTSSDGRPLGIASFFSDVAPNRMEAHSELVDCLRPVLSRALDRLPSLAAFAELSGNVLGGVALDRAGEPVPLPGLPGHPLLSAGAPLLAYVRSQLAAAGGRISFLAPAGSGLVSITALNCQEPGTDRLNCVVLVRPAGHAAEIPRPRLQRWGALLEGWPEQQIPGGLREGRETPAGHDPSADGHADPLVVASRDGLYIPPALW